MKVHRIAVRGRRCTCDDRELVQGTAGQDAIALSLDSEWEGLEVTVTLRGAAGSYTPAARDGTWPVPHELLADVGEIEVGIEGRRGADVLRSVRMEWPMTVLPSLDGPGRTPADPTVDDYTQALLDVKASIRASTDALRSVESALADVSAVLSAIESYGVAEWGVSPDDHRLRIGPVRTRKEGADG